MTKSTIRAALVAGAMMLAAAAAAQPVKVGTIDMARLEKEAPVTLRATEILKKEFEPRRIQVESQLKQAIAAGERFKKERAGLPPDSARNRESEVMEVIRRAEQARARFLEELEVRKREMRARFFEEANVAVKQVAEAGKFDLIVHKAAFARPSIDVTPLVLKEMAKRTTSLR